MSQYQDLLKKLFEVNLFGGMKLGLENCLKLQKLLKIPDQSIAFIHVAGTNGKGSVTLKMATALQAAGYKVGLYTSPHISSFRERIKINRKLIAEDDVVFNLKKIIENKIEMTFFETTTILAFLYFAKEKVDFAVIETGIGGRKDA